MSLVLSRRGWLQGSVAIAAAAFANNPMASFGFGPLEEGEELIPFLDVQPVDPGRPAVNWQELKEWITPLENFFAVSHYGVPTVDAASYNLSVEGLVEKPLSLTLDEIKARPKAEVTATIECSGNGASNRFMGAVGNAVWSGTPLAPLLKEAGLKKSAREVVFFGADSATEKIRGMDYTQNFGRSLSLDDAQRDDILLGYEMNGQPLVKEHGAPLRLIVPGWYGIAWVKWLSRIELHDRRFMGKFMARDYVTIRGEEKDGKTIWRETSVGRMNVKSLVGRVVKRKDGTIVVNGAAWSDGGKIDRVELKIDDGQWAAATLSQPKDAPYSWTFWSYEWKNPPEGEHTLVSRATDSHGRVQPSADDPEIKQKKTYWEAYQQYPRKIKV